VIIRPIEKKDAESFFNMMCLLDEETKYMMYEPGERLKKTKGLNLLAGSIEKTLEENDLLQVAVNDENEIVGYIWAERGKFNRTLHTAYIVVGIREAFRDMGIGTKFFTILDDWALSNGVVRLELTVECENEIAKKLYEKQGFVVEGKRIKSMKVDGKLVDEYYMAKIM